MDKKFMLEALKEAKIAKRAGNLPFGSVIVFNNKIISKGHAENDETGDITRHAEMLAIRNACHLLDKSDLEKCTIYCTNEPCIMCGGAIIQANISKVVIGVSRGDLPGIFRQKKINFSDLIINSSHKIVVVLGVLKDQIIPLFNK